MRVRRVVRLVLLRSPGVRHRRRLRGAPRAEPAPLSSLRALRQRRERLAEEHEHGDGLGERAHLEAVGGAEVERQRDDGEGGDGVRETIAVGRDADVRPAQTRAG